MNIIVGLGAEGRDWLQLLRGRRDAAIACVDDDEGALAWAKGQVRPDRCATRLEDVLSGTKADAAIIASPPERRAADAVRALEAGLAVIIEPPVALSAADAVRIVETSRRSGRRAIVVQRNRMGACERTMRRLLRDGRIGAVTHVSCVDRRAQPAEAGRARATRHAQLLHAAAPHLDSLRHILGLNPLAVIARSSSSPWSDYAHGSTTEAIVRMEGAIHVQYHGSLTADRNTHALWIDGEAGVLWTDRARVWWRKRGWPVFVPVLRRAAGDGPRVHELASLLDGLQESAPDTPPHDASLDDAVWTAAMLEAAIQSDMTGSAVAIEALLSGAGAGRGAPPPPVQEAR